MMYEVCFGGFFYTHAVILVVNLKLELGLIWRDKSFLCSPLHPAGSNGHEFMFLLKGHEDLRQDERVMQLFGLVNTLLANDPASLRKNLRQASRIHASEHLRQCNSLKQIISGK